MQEQLVSALRRTLESKDQKVSVRETHISWILLQGARAWKIKKAVKFNFLDFSTLAKRKQACEEELRLNRRFAPEIYLSLARISGPIERPAFNGPTPAIEYAVCMKRFDETSLLSQLAENQQLETSHIDALANEVARIHQRIGRATSEPDWGKPENIYHWLSDSLIQLGSLIDTADEQQQITHITHACETMFIRLKKTLSTRNQAGFIRECHGDLHLDNMVWINNKLVPFDCIEFNPALRWIDVMSETSFVMMDLQSRGYTNFAWRFINHYLSSTGDYGGIEVLKYYLVYRALVRAKVSRLQSIQTEATNDKKQALVDRCHTYIELAEQYLNQHRPALILMHGLSASGKSSIAASLAERYGCVQLRADVERKRLHGLDPLQASESQVNTGIYSTSASKKTYQQLAKYSADILRAGYPVIVDAAFLQRAQRQAFTRLAKKMICPFLIIHCQATKEILEYRLIERARRGNDPSEATLAVLNKQLETQDKLGKDENAIHVLNGQSVALDRVMKDIFQNRPGAHTLNISE